MINIANFVDPKVFKARLQQMMDNLRKEPNDGLSEVLAAGDPEKKIYRKRNRLGLPIDDELINRFSDLLPSLSINTL